MRRKARRYTRSMVSRYARKTASRARDISRCYSCRDGRLVQYKNLVFCGFCGKEFRRTSL